jgi:hypothetical protein
MEDPRILNPGQTNRSLACRKVRSGTAQRPGGQDDRSRSGSQTRNGSNMPRKERDDEGR